MIEYPGVKIDPYTGERLVKRALISDYCPLGNLDENISFLSFEEKIGIAKDLLEALNYMHNHHKKDGTTCWLHLDVKPKNILIAINGGKKRGILCDFGFTGPQADKRKFKGGTLCYAAPELLSKVRFGEVGPHTDIWAAGLTLHELFIGDLPDWMQVYSGWELQFVFQEGKDVESWRKSLNQDSSINQLLSGMLQIDSSKRLNAKECLEILNRLQS